ncbi:MAG: polymer-forming cytoskeletal protein [Patescibacteria group bacterium]|nr:polymer-forming cytoskeletal protein [Patescibacteria group bacterium]
MGNLKFRNRKVVVVAFALALISLPTSALAAFFLHGRAGVPLQVAKDQIVQGDYITMGETIDLQGNVDGDVIVAGNRVTIAGNVSGDVIAAASELLITGTVEGNIRVAGMDVIIGGTVGRNLNVWGSQVTLNTTAHVGRNAYIVAESLAFSGAIDGGLATRARNQTLGGTVKGDSYLELGAEGSAVLPATAKFEGALSYQAAADGQLQRDPAATVSGTVHRDPVSSPTPAQQFAWLFFYRIVGLFGMLVVGLVLVSLVPRYMVELAQQALVRQPWLSLAWGLVITVATPMLAVVLFFTIIGIPLALMLVAAYLAVLYLGQVVAGIAIGMWIFARTSGGRFRGSLLAPMVCGLCILVAVTGFIGPVGALLKMVAVLWGVGAIGKMKAKQLKEWR